jgi:alpha-D-ribose 1-methylphosphonate 5-triphosphate synthase subunit PhnH
MQTEALTGGFTNAPTQAAEAFRAVMRAMARPGTIERIMGAAPPAPLSPAAGAVILTLCDPETPVHLAGVADTPMVRHWITFHSGAPLVDRARASFALGSWPALLPLTDYPIGNAEYPDRSTTLIVEMPTLHQSGARLTGPGIETTAALSLPESAAFQRNAALYPLGLDFLFTSGDHLAALPRSTRVEGH